MHLAQALVSTTGFCSHCCAGDAVQQPLLGLLYLDEGSGTSSKSTTSYAGGTVMAFPSSLLLSGIQRPTVLLPSCENIIQGNGGAAATRKQDTE
jgi:hypothetical protein